MLDMRSKQYRAEMDARLEEDRQRRERAEMVVADCRDSLREWQPIEEMPFAAYADCYGENATVLLSNGKKVAVASVKKRFGRPIKVVDMGKPAMTDHGFTYVGAKYEEYDHPDWWFEWEFTDLLSDDDERWGRSEVGFIPTHWMPLPDAPTENVE